MPAPEAALGDELRRIRAAVEDLRTLMRDLITTARFNRGGYDGPFLRGVLYGVPSTTSIEIYPGRGEPAAILIDVAGTGNANDTLYVSADPTARGGYRLPIANDAQLRVICDQHQRLWAQADAQATVDIRVLEGKL